MVHLIDKVLHGDPGVNMLFGPNNNPFYNATTITTSSEEEQTSSKKKIKQKTNTKKQSSIQGQPPTYVRAMLYEVITTMNF